MERDFDFYESIVYQLSNDSLEDEKLEEFLARLFHLNENEIDALLELRPDILSMNVVMTDEVVPMVEKALEKVNSPKGSLGANTSSERPKKSNMKITKLNYFAEAAKVDKTLFDEAMNKAHDLLKRLTNEGANWNPINSNETLSKVATNQFEALELLLQEIKGNKGKSENEGKKRSPAAHRPAAEKSHSGKMVKPKTETSPTIKQTAKNINKRAPKLKHGKPVETVDPHLLILARYRRLHGKTVAKDKVRGLAAALVKQIEARILRKKSEYSSTIEEMRSHIFKLIQNSKGSNVVVNIPEKTLTAIDKAINSEHKMKSVQLLSRYAGMAGRITTLQKAKKLYNDMFSAIENDAIPEEDRYFERVTDVMKNLKKYVEHEDESAELELLPAELSGILGCGCKKEPTELNGIDTDFDDDDYSPEREPEREVNTEPYVGKSGMKPVNSLVFMQRKFNRYHIDEPWVRVFGHIEPGKHLVVYSKEKLGKTTALVDFAGYLSKHHGPVLFVQKEEELSGTFQDKFEQTQAANPNFDVLEELPDDETLRKYRFVFLDSVTRLKMTPDQLLELQHRLAPDVTFIAVLHATKDGQHRGANTFVQDASQIVEFPEFGAAKGRGRFKGCTGELVRFAEQRE